MKAIGSSFSAWKSIEKQEGVRKPHGLVFSLAVIAEIGKPHGLEIVAEEETELPAADFDAIMISVLDSRCMIGAVQHFRRWGVPFRRKDRAAGKWPLVWCGGQGVHNPRPLGDVCDLFVIGDAEDPLPELLGLWEKRGNGAWFLDAASMVPGVWVPSRHDPRECRIAQSVARDIGASVRSQISVSYNRNRRIEIARGCRSKCAYCSLGWRAPYRENGADGIIESLGSGHKQVHFQAGDAESHSEIAKIRDAAEAIGCIDQGWTGRVDSLMTNPDQTIPSTKRYAFGVEAMTYRVRRAVGKGYLTDDRLVDDTCDFFSMIEGDNKGRGAWHMIAGLPGERRYDTLSFASVIKKIDSKRRGRTPRNLSIHWQPFQPQPGTPMQWFPSGVGAQKLASSMRCAEGLPWCRVRNIAGRTDSMALICSVLARSDERGAKLLEALDAGPVSPAQAAEIAGVGFGPLSPDAELPWDFVDHFFARSALEKAYATVVKRLGDELAKE